MKILLIESLKSFTYLYIYVVKFKSIIYILLRRYEVV